MTLPNVIQLNDPDVGMTTLGFPGVGVATDLGLAHNLSKVIELSASDALDFARASLSGRRVALVGFSPLDAAPLTAMISDAEGFTRLLSPSQVSPSSEILKPFELILVHLESCAGSAWLDPEQLVPVAHRSIALGKHAPLMQAAAHPFLRFIDYCAFPGVPEECLLRCVRVLHAPAGAALQSPVDSKPGPAAGSNVVLADDDTSVTSIVRRALERNGLTCQIAANGGEAVSLITRVKPCAAVLDVDMPTLDGFEVLSRIRSSPDLAATRVILLTGSDQESDIIRGFSLGASDYVCKPFSPMELTIRLMRVIGRL